MIDYLSALENRFLRLPDWCVLLFLFGVAAFAALTLAVYGTNFRKPATVEQIQQAVKECPGVAKQIAEKADPLSVWDLIDEVNDCKYIKRITPLLRAQKDAARAAGGAIE